MMIMDKNLLRELAQSFIGTPHINGGNIKGAGLDCCTLPAQIFHEAGLGDYTIDFNYSADWFCQKGCKEILLPYLEKYCIRVEQLEPGDVISYRWGRAEYAHLAVYLGNNVVVHCRAANGVEFIEADAPCFYDSRGRSRVSGFWRVKE